MRAEFLCSSIEGNKDNLHDFLEGVDLEIEVTHKLCELKGGFVKASSKVDRDEILSLFYILEVSFLASFASKELIS